MKSNILVLLLLNVFWMSPIEAYQIQIEKGPAIDAGPNTFLINQPLSPNEGEKLIDWLGGAENIDRVLIGTPHINSNQVEFSTDYVRTRLENSVCVNSQKDSWSYAPLTMGTIYLVDGSKINFSMYLSGLTLAENLFSSKSNR